MLAALLLSLLIAAEPPASSLRRLPPVDRCAGDSSFAAFRDDLLSAIERRDAAHVLRVAADDISVDFGGGAGRDYFREAWKLQRPAQSELWRELAEVLRLGCDVAEDGSYWAPALHLSDQVDDVFETLLAVRPGSVLRAAPDDRAAAVAELEWDLLQALEWDEEGDWWKVRMADGREGYARRSDLRMPADFRAGFQKVDGRWRMIAFIAGD